MFYYLYEMPAGITVVVLIILEWIFISFVNTATTSLVTYRLEMS